MQKYSSAKPGTPSVLPSKAIITNWLKSLFPDLPINMKIEDFGDGVIYCRLLSHYYGNPPHSKITWAPKNQYQYANNLRHVQTALTQLEISITFDVVRISKRKFLENWALINAFYKHLNTNDDFQILQENSASNHGNFTNLQAPFMHQSHQLLQRAPQIVSNPLISTQKALKRPGSITPSSFQQPRLAPRLPNMYLPLQNSHPQSVWDHRLTTLAHSSLQMSQYLKQNMNVYNISPSKGKWSVGSQMFQNNQSAVIDRVKQILLKGSHDTEKVRQIKMLLGMPVEEQQVIKIQDDGGFGPIVHAQTDSQPLEQEQLKESNNCLQINPKEASNCKQAKLSVSKISKKPFKV